MGGCQLKNKKTYTLLVALLISLAATGVRVEAQPSQKQLTTLAEAFVKRLTPLLPIKSGDMTLFAINQTGSILIYEHTVDVYIPPEYRSFMNDWLRGQAYRSACSVPVVVSFIKDGGNIYYRFFYNNQVLTIVKVEGC